MWMCRCSMGQKIRGLEHSSQYAELCEMYVFTYLSIEFSRKIITYVEAFLKDWEVSHRKYDRYKNMGHSDAGFQSALAGYVHESKT